MESRRLKATTDRFDRVVATLSDQTKQRDVHERSISFRISTAPWPNTNTSEPGFFVAIPWRCFYFSTTKNNGCITQCMDCREFSDTCTANVAQQFKQTLPRCKEWPMRDRDDEGNQISVIRSLQFVVFVGFGFPIRLS